MGIYVLDKKEETVIKIAEIKKVGKGVMIGNNTYQSSKLLKTESNLTFLSDEIISPTPHANAAVLSWDQTDGGEGATLEIRTNNNGTWSEWVVAGDPDERKDNTPITHTALIIGDRIKKIQYRFILQALEGHDSSEINLENASIEMIDTTQGPSPTNDESVFERVLGKLGFDNTTQARMDGPRIYSRAEWGSPEPTSSEGWTPEYAPLTRVIVHHTAIPVDSDPAASIRAIWYYHTYTNGWGDIGYNYLVDSRGNIYQGRYYDPVESAVSGGEVVGGHAYQNNIGSSGIAALGDFSTTRPTDIMVDAIANIAAFKAANYKFNPSGIGVSGPNVVGHRDVNATSCPGQQLYDRLYEVRTVGDIYYIPRVAMNRYDLTNQGQGYDSQPSTNTVIMAGDTKEAYFDLRNEGDESWNNTGPNTVFLGTDEARDRSSIFSDEWVSPNRAATFSEKIVVDELGQVGAEPATTIEPGEVGRFKFPVKPPATASGQHLEQFQLVVEGKEWFTRNLRLSTTIDVTPQIFSWRPLGQHIYTDDQLNEYSDTNMSPGESVFLVLKAQNTGNQTWVKDGSGPNVRVASSYYRDRTSSFCHETWVNCSRPNTFSEASVAPGETATFGFWIRTPSPSRNFLYYDHYSLVAEGVTWMNTEPGVYWPIQLFN
ncbi:hypothetical protein EOM57_03150 [Candidatus Saccharibacteria bacterium]|nr:hypothetical protein [Candidatus Saccharibacteria bacterium]